jgi:hypothetical protein
MEGVKDLEVLMEEGIASVVVRQLFLAPLVQLLLPLGRS